jgi:hypothetical protein
MIQLAKNHIIYILSPSKYFSGGPLALHQLAYEMKLLEYNVVMLYTDIAKDESDLINSNFKNFKLPYITNIKEVIDTEYNVLILPEVNIKMFQGFSFLKKVIWWLSIDNYYKAYIYNTPLLSSLPKTKIISRFLDLVVYFKNKKFNIFSSKEFGKYYHLCQSEYAFQFIGNKAKNKKNIGFLTDYLHESFLNKSEEIINLTDKQDVILYNPKKGVNFTKKIISKNNNLKFIAVENFTPDEVVDLLKKSKIYIDFGNHPGRDRFPREAALMGCCVLVGLKGSAMFHKDMPFDDKYKFLTKESNLTKISDTLLDIITNYKEHKDKFSTYREFIKTNKSIFIKEIKNIFSMNY